MPVMSGFELLSVVRRRFTNLAVIAISGHYDGAAPGGAIADAFFSKAQYSREQLFEKILELLERSPLRPNIAKPDKTPVWIPRSDTGYVVVTCPECLRSFPTHEERCPSEYCETTCIHCEATVSYLIDR